MKNNKRLIRVILVLLMLLMITTQSVFATTTIPLNTNDSVEVQKIVENLSKSLNKESGDTTKVSIKTKASNAEGARVVVLEYKDSGTGKTLEFYQDDFVNADQKEAKKVLEGLVEGLRTSSISKNTQQNIMTAIQESDSKVASMMVPLIFDNSQADLFSAYKILQPFFRVLSVLLGIGAYIIIIMLLASTVIDLLYIGLPVFREKADEKEKKHPFGVSYEALTTVKEVEAGLSESNYRNAYILYFKRRALSYIVLGICILYLIAGQLGGIITFVLNLVSGFM